jgi:hypothetical protein
MLLRDNSGIAYRIRRVTAKFEQPFAVRQAARLRTRRAEPYLSPVADAAGIDVDEI